jgi:hypothetical protein
LDCFVEMFGDVNKAWFAGRLYCNKINGVIKKSDVFSMDIPLNEELINHLEQEFIALNYITLEGDNYIVNSDVFFADYVKKVGGR